LASGGRQPIFIFDGAVSAVTLETTMTRFAPLGVLVLAILAGSATAAGAPDWHAQARCIAAYEAAANALEDQGGQAALVQRYDRNREKASLALATRTDLPSSTAADAEKKTEAKRLGGASADEAVGAAKACDKVLGY
jgi:Flp pilus assembly protein TadD